MSIFDPTAAASVEQRGIPGFDESPSADEMNAAFGPAGWTEESIDEYEQYLAEHPEEMDRCLLAELFNQFDAADQRLAAQLERDRRANEAWACQLDTFTGGERGVA